MKRKFLVLSCLIFLILGLYFTFTIIKVETEESPTENQQQPTEVDKNTTKENRLFKIKSPKSQAESLNQPTDEELEVAIDFLKSLDKESGSEGLEEKREKKQSETSKTEVAETQDSARTISPEREEMFIYYKGIGDQHRELARKIAPLMRRFVELDERIEELGNLIIEKTNRGEEHQKLVEERQQLYEEKVEVSEGLKPYDQRTVQLEKEWEEYLRTHHRMSINQFRETYATAFRSWLANQ